MNPSLVSFSHYLEKEVYIKILSVMVDVATLEKGIVSIGEFGILYHK